MLVDNNLAGGSGTCASFCAAVGRACIGAWADDSDTCGVLFAFSCNQYGGSDMICECGGLTAAPPATAG